MLKSKSHAKKAQLVSNRKPRDPFDKSVEKFKGAMKKDERKNCS